MDWNRSSSDPTVWTRANDNGFTEVREYEYRADFETGVSGNASLGYIPNAVYGYTPHSISANGTTYTASVESDGIYVRWSTDGLVIAGSKKIANEGLSPRVAIDAAGNIACVYENNLGEILVYDEPVVDNVVTPRTTILGLYRPYGELTLSDDIEDYHSGEARILLDPQGDLVVVWYKYQAELPAPGGANQSIYVYNEYDNQPIQGAVVSLYGNDGLQYSGTTGIDGKLTLAIVEDYLFTRIIEAIKDGFYPAYFWINFIWVPGQGGISIPMTPMLEEPPDWIGYIQGTVYDGASATDPLAPLPGVSVTATGPGDTTPSPAITSALGHYMISVGAIGDYAITFELDGYATIIDGFQIGSNQIVTLDEIMYPIVDNPTKICGHVTDSITGSPIQGAMVMINYNEVLRIPTIFTDSTGYYEFDNLTSGSYYLYFSANEYHPGWILPFDVGEGETVTKDKALVPIKEGSIRGHVYDKELYDIDPLTAGIPDCPLVAEGFDSDGHAIGNLFDDWTRSNEDGSYMFNNLDVGDYLIFANHPNITYWAALAEYSYKIERNIAVTDDGVAIRDIFLHKKTVPPTDPSTAQGYGTTHKTYSGSDMNDWGIQALDQYTSDFTLIPIDLHPSEEVQSVRLLEAIVPTPADRVICVFSASDAGLPGDDGTIKLTYTESTPVELPS